MRDPWIISRPAPERRPRYQYESEDRLERVYQQIRQQYLLEKLRYKGYVKRGTLASFMQTIGDFGRKMFGVVTDLKNPF